MTFQSFLQFPGNYQCFWVNFHAGHFRIRDLAHEHGITHSSQHLHDSLEQILTHGRGRMRWFLWPLLAQTILGFPGFCEAGVTLQCPWAVGWLSRILGGTDLIRSACPAGTTPPPAVGQGSLTGVQQDGGQDWLNSSSSPGSNVFFMPFFFFFLSATFKPPKSYRTQSIVMHTITWTQQEILTFQLHAQNPLTHVYFIWFTAILFFHLL